MALNQTFIDDYKDPNSVAFQTLAAQITADLLAFFQSNPATKNIFAVVIKAFRSGSVVVDFEVVSNETNMAQSSVATVVSDGIDNGNFTSIQAIPSNITAQGISLVLFFLSGIFGFAIKRRIPLSLYIASSL